ncbi:glucose-6-phosphate isomerase family protein [Tritrichomonas foetus]|uniref:Glucose-6-phosphate isomerase n=1 Tax=Tritrichomonas foetus TaxID=1144522 RepID=A0A1J4K3X1_9EUKA|nr:glucose-6-phosphate isomerase family protein [Tritrichomonas foetus]|eukprot:OHT06145.1 glucose-6-phosphate isomerase family protein [Tritrichomonas foetus]
MTDTYFDPSSGFRFDVHFESTFSNIENVYSTQQPKFEKALDLIKRMEAGEIVNHTEVKAESEDRQVDHYNLRLQEEKVPGKSLAHTLKLWEETLQFARDVESGKIKPSKAGKYDTIIFNGIGGSYLGPQMLIIAKYGADYNTTAHLPFKIYFTSNTDSDLFHQVTSNVSIESTIMVHLSKSGTTSETAGNMHTWMDLCRAKGLPVGEHSACVTIRDSLLDRIAQEQKFIRSWHMEVDTGGRTSVCSAIGMVPCAFAHLDFAAFIKGMSDMDVLTRKTTLTENPAAILASIINRQSEEQGFKNMIVLCYSEFMKEFAHYLQQLYMESLGKEYTVEGKPAHVGQTVFGGVGTGEQHAFMQQVQKGLPDCFVRIIHFEKRNHDYSNAQAGSMGRQLLAFVNGTEKALLKNKRPFIDLSFPERNEYSFGMMIALEERIVTFLGSYLGINSYDQPGVQDGKLAASAVNKLSAAIVKELETKSAKGTAVEVLKALGIEGQHYEAESILNDIYNNHAVKDAYPSLEALKVTREFCPKAKQFVFTFDH